jgi:hypothetical protein
MKKIKSFLMMAITITRRIIAVLDFPTDIDDFITYARGIHQSMSTNPLFAGLAAKIATLLLNINKLETFHTGTKATPPTHTAAQRDTELTKVKNNLRDLRMDVQALADADTANAEVIIEAAGMKVKRFSPINKQDLAAKDGTVSGNVKLVAKGIGVAHAAHDWAKSQDGTNWTPMTPTLAATTEEEGFTPGSIWDFRHRNILKDGPTDWIEINDWVVR